ncbi:MAG: LysM peptidoglycan-binding domain-containing protein [Bdellovibrio sp.]|nr:LysM peptidoglycan-binding domain-containing protein [Bdellovibrio sp.]
MKIVLSIVLFLFLFSCAHKDRSNPQERNVSESIPGVINNFLTEKENRVQKQDAASSTEVSQVEMKAELQLDVDKTIQKIDVGSNAQVEDWIDFFARRDRERFIRMLERGSAYKEVVQNILIENGLPKELFYLALIESGFVTHAKSRARAVGVWQFMQGTSKRYGLSTNGHVDERRDPIRATEAAAKYLRELYEVFQSWDLALAAYNCGEHRVLGAVMRGGTRDFWKLYEKGLLPKETRNYVPKFRAAVLVGENPGQYGIDVKVPMVIYPDLEAVEVPSPVSLAEVARRVGMDVEDIKKYNPHLSGGITPPQYDRYEVWLPTSQAKILTPQADTIPKIKVITKVKRENFEEKYYHHVRTGDNLSTLARRYKQSVSHLKSINNLSSNRLYVGQKLRISVKSYHVNTVASQKVTSKKTRHIASGTRPRIYLHKVKRGETLHALARRFGVTVKTIKDANRIARGQIFAGQTVKIPL